MSIFNTPISAFRTGPIIPALVILTSMGCQSVKYTPSDEAKYFKPTIAVMSFENRVPIATKWQLGDALADQLTDRLMATNRYIVLERDQLRAILYELERSGDPVFRRTGQLKKGQLKNVQYLVKGVITDFGHIEKTGGLMQPVLGLFGSNSNSIAAATIYVMDVQTSQIVASTNVEAKIRDGESDEKVNLDSMALGGYTFYQTSLGRATNEMLNEAVRAIANSIAEQHFQPKIASVTNNQIIITGGKDRQIKIGDEFVVRPQSQKVLDPDTGDTLGHVTGSTIGHIRVTQVTEKFSVAEIIEGTQFSPGQTLFSTSSESGSIASY